MIWLLLLDRKKYVSKKGFINARSPLLRSAASGPSKTGSGMLIAKVSGVINYYEQALIACST